MEDAFDSDIRAGLAHSIELMVGHIAEIYGVETHTLTTTSIQEIDKIPAGVAMLMSNLFGLSALLVVETDAQSEQLLTELNRKLVPIVVASLLLPTTDTEEVN